MENLTTLQTPKQTVKWFREKPINVLLIGNSPLQLSSVYDLLIGMKGKRFSLTTAFSLEDSLQRAFKHKPECILIDDTFSNRNIKTFVRLLNQQRNKRLQRTPVALLKSSNHKDLPSNGIQDFLLKSTLTSESLAKAILKAIKMRRAYYDRFYKTYRYGRRKLRRWLR